MAQHPGSAVRVWAGKPVSVVGMTEETGGSGTDAVNDVIFSQARVVPTLVAPTHSLSEQEGQVMYTCMAHEEVQIA
jgi:hypothetical protein